MTSRWAAGTTTSASTDKFYALVTYQHGKEYRNSTGFLPPAGSGDINSQRTDQNYITAWTHVLNPRLGARRSRIVFALHHLLPAIHRLRFHDRQGRHDQDAARAHGSQEQHAAIRRQRPDAAICAQQLGRVEQLQPVELRAQPDSDARPPQPPRGIRVQLRDAGHRQQGVGQRNLQLRSRLDPPALRFRRRQPWTAVRSPACCSAIPPAHRSTGRTIRTAPVRTWPSTRRTTGKSAAP